jgi:hypothetical protein
MTWARPVHFCRGCGVEGRLSLADPDLADRRPILRIAFDGAAGRPQLLCALCRPSESPVANPQPEPVNG